MNIIENSQEPANFVRDLGPIFQIAYVERDLERAFSSWNALGVGPFFVADRVLVPYEYQDEKLEAELTLAFTYWGDMQIEIIKQHDDKPSVYRRWMDGSQSGIHHVCILVDDIAELRERSISAGLSIEQEMSTASADVLYAKLPHGCAHFVEFAQYAPGTAPLFDRIKQACATWDGSHPIRSLADFI